MSSAKPPAYMPLAWPVSSVLFAVTTDAKDPPPAKLESAPELDFVEHLISMCTALRSFILAYAIIYWCYRDGEYPAFGRATNLEWSWMWPIIVRDLIATWLICGLWDFFLYFGFGFPALKAKLAKFKINPRYPSTRQVCHDAAFTTLSAVIGAFAEIMCCHLWCIGAFPQFNPDLTAKPVFNALWILSMSYWRSVYGWGIHRVMHPWKIEGIPDMGKFLYRHFHSLHHRSYNPTAFSGLSMHPVESVLYFCQALIAVPFGCHPAIILACIIDATLGEFLGHDGFHWPGAGDDFHLLHHALFDCNYGSPHVPFDKWLGTFAGNKDDFKKVWGNKCSGADANETPVHLQAYKLCRKLWSFCWYMSFSA